MASLIAPLNAALREQTRGYVRCANQTTGAPRERKAMRAEKQTVWTSRLPPVMSESEQFGGSLYYLVNGVIKYAQRLPNFS